VERALEEAQQGAKKPIGLVMGADFARFVLRFGVDIVDG
jgi:hypothetical protein